MDSSLYNINQLFTKEHCTFNSSHLAQQTTQPQLGIYQEEESVDFSALVEACEKTTFDIPSSGNTSSDPLSSSSFFPEATSDSAFPFDNLMPSLNVYNTDSNGFQSPPSLAADFSQQPTPIASSVAISTTNLHHNHVSTPMISVNPSPVAKAVKSGKTAKKGALDKDSNDYRLKRDRNNEAVRKSRIKSKQRVYETEKRVKDLEDENGQLQNKIALLTKELNVLKSLFVSAGVSYPSIKMEVDATLSSTQGGSD